MTLVKNRALTLLIVPCLAGALINGAAMAQSPGDSPWSAAPSVKSPSLSTAVFIENLGQFDSRVRYQAKIGAQTAWLTENGIVFDATRPASTEKVAVDSATPRGASSDLFGSSSSLNAEKSQLPNFDRLVFTEDFMAATCCSKIEGSGPRLGVYNYIQDSDSTRWHTNIHGYSGVVYRDVWPSIDLKIYGNGPDLEQEFIVRPGADLSQIRISYRGIENIETAQDGSLLARTAFGTLRETKPRIYQDIAGQQRTVDGKFKILSRTSYSFEIGQHSEGVDLIVDPTLLYSTFLGGTAGTNDITVSTQGATSIAVDSSGNAYVAGNTIATDFPTTPGSFQLAPPGTAFVSKLSATGSALIYSTYLGNGTAISAVAVDSSGQAYVTGWTTGTFFPTTPNAFWPTNSQQHCNGGDSYVTVLAPAGNGLTYSTCLNANPAVVYGVYIRSVAVDSRGKVYIAGASGTGSPTTPSAFQPVFPGGTSAYLAIFDTTASGSSSLVYGTYLGPASGSEAAYAYGVALDSFGKVYVTGSAYDGFPVTSGAFQTTHSSAQTDVFVAKFDPAASGQSSLIYATYIGGAPTGGCPQCGSAGSAIAVDTSGNTYIAGVTQSPQFPTTPGAFQTSCPGFLPGSVFVSKLSAGGSQLAYSTCLAGTATGYSAGGIAVDSLGNVYVAGGFTASAQATFPVTANAFQSSFSKLSGEYEAFLTELNPSGSGLVYSSYLGGNGDDRATSVAIDQTGDAYIAGFTTSPNFPVSPTAFQPTLNLGGGYRYPQAAFVTKFPLGSVQTLSISSLSPTSGGNAGTVTISIQGGGFHNGASVSLIGAATIMGDATVGSEGRTMTSTLDLTGTPVGSYSLVVTNPDGTTTLLSNAFTVLSGGGSNIGLSLTGLAVNHGSNTKVVLETTISNKGTVDLPSGFVVTPLGSSFSLTSSSPAGLANLTQSSSVGFNVVVSDPTAPGSSQTITATESSTVLTSCDTPPLSAQLCYYPVIGTDPSIFDSCMDAGRLSVSAGCGLAVGSCVGKVTVGAVISCVSSIAGCGSNIQMLVNTCLAKAQVLGPKVCSSAQLACVHAIDPNGLVGPAGIGGQRWISGTQALTYVIAFNNEPTAAVPAQQVVVTQSLGPNINLSNLGLLGITIPNGTGDIQTSVPAAAFNPSVGTNEFITNVDLRPTQDLLVNVDALLKSATHTLTWTLTSIDPATGQPPLNPRIGFLPPGAGATAAYSVTPQQGLATGTQIAEQASVVFDGQAPISTAVWTNTIDNRPPVSHVSSLPSASSCPAFKVSWSGSDVGSGIQGFTIYSSDNGGSFSPWLSNTTAAAATFTGTVGHTYSFYGIATDLTGNVEAAKTSSEASTMVTSAGSCGPPSLNAQALNVAQSGTTVTANLQLTNAGFAAAQTININQITLRTLSGSGTVTLSGPALPLAVGSLAIGASTTVPLILNVPSTVTRFSLTEGGTVKDAGGNGYSFSIAQTIIP